MYTCCKLCVHLVYLHKYGVWNQILSGVFKARLWTACTVSQRKQEGPARSPPKPAHRTKTRVLLPSSAEAHVSDEAHRIHSDSDYDDDLLISMAWLLQFEKRLNVLFCLKQTVITRSACPCQAVRWWNRTLSSTSSAVRRTSATPLTDLPLLYISMIHKTAFNKIEYTWIKLHVYACFLERDNISTLNSYLCNVIKTVCFKVVINIKIN